MHLLYQNKIKLFSSICESVKCTISLLKLNFNEIILVKLSAFSKMAVFVKFVYTFFISLFKLKISKYVLIILTITRIEVLTNLK